MEWQKGDVVKIESDDVLNYVLVLDKEQRNTGKEYAYWYKVYSISAGSVYKTFLSQNNRLTYTLHSRNNEQL